MDHRKLLDLLNSSKLTFSYYCGNDTYYFIKTNIDFILVDITFDCLEPKRRFYFNPTRKVISGFNKNGSMFVTYLMIAVFPDDSRRNEMGYYCGFNPNLSKFVGFDSFIKRCGMNLISADIVNLVGMENVEVKDSEELSPEYDPFKSNLDFVAFSKTIGSPGGALNGENSESDDDSLLKIYLKKTYWSHVNVDLVSVDGVYDIITDCETFLKVSKDSNGYHQVEVMFDFLRSDEYCDFINIMIQKDQKNLPSFEVSRKGKGDKAFKIHTVAHKNQIASVIDYDFLSFLEKQFKKKYYSVVTHGSSYTYFEHLVHVNYKGVFYTYAIKR